eukprot:6780650-Pyramimonas_sp.AAC.1
MALSRAFFSPLEAVASKSSLNSPESSRSRQAGRDIATERSAWPSGEAPPSLVHTPPGFLVRFILSSSPMSWGASPWRKKVSCARQPASLRVRSRLSASGSSLESGRTCSCHPSA